MEITRPTNNAAFWARNTVVLNATACAQNGGSITNVKFYNGTNVIGTAWPSIGNTFALAWTNAPLWTNVLTAVATDSGGLQSTSAPVAVTVSLTYTFGSIRLRMTSSSPHRPTSCSSPARAITMEGQTSV